MHEDDEADDTEEVSTRDGESDEDNNGESVGNEESTIDTTRPFNFRDFVAFKRQVKDLFLGSRSEERRRSNDTGKVDQSSNDTGERDPDGGHTEEEDARVR